MDPTKNNFTRLLIVKEILGELISKDQYYTFLPRSKDFVFNNYFNVCLKIWQANIDIQLVFKEYKPVKFVCQYFSKSEDHCS